MLIKCINEIHTAAVESVKLLSGASILLLKLVLFQCQALKLLIQLILIVQFLIIFIYFYFAIFKCTGQAA